MGRVLQFFFIVVGQVSQCSDECYLDLNQAEISWRRGVGRQRNGLVDNELTRLTPCAKPSCKVGAGGALAQGIAESISACPDGSYATRIRTMPENHIEFFTMVRHFFWRILIIQGCNDGLGTVDSAPIISHGQ
jgi:hypothetical protein